METSRANALIHRSDGQTFAMDDRPIGLLEIRGVDAPAMEVFTEKNAVGDGDTVTGSRVASRDITLRAKSRGGIKNAILRARAVAFFDPQYTYDVDISYDGVTRTARDCRLKAVAIPSGSLYQPLDITATFLCPYGYLDGEGGMDGVDLNSIQAWMAVCVDAEERHRLCHGERRHGRNPAASGRRASRLPAGHERRRRA